MAQAQELKLSCGGLGAEKRHPSLPLSDVQIAALKDPATEINIQKARRGIVLGNKRAPFPFRMLQHAEPIGRT